MVASAQSTGSNGKMTAITAGLIPIQSLNAVFSFTAGTAVPEPERSSCVRGWSRSNTPINPTRLNFCRKAMGWGWLINSDGRHNLLAYGLILRLA